MKSEDRPDLSVFTMEELFAEISSRVTASVLLVEYPAMKTGQPNELGFYANGGQSVAVGMMARIMAKFLLHT